MEEFNDLRKISQEDLELVLCVLNGVDPGNNLIPDIKQELNERYLKSDKIIEKYKKYIGKYIKFYDDETESYCRIDELKYDSNLQMLSIKSHVNIQINYTGIDPNDIVIFTHWPDTDEVISISLRYLDSNIKFITEQEYNKILNKALYGRVQ